ncbi:ATP-binding protein [Actinoplanes sp. NPDC051494]|uniref:sensor histidine kinase n=1 Tax=Actinoplanes sp. NPDC051494 TaxID=3363907 RepID=UPI0037ACDEEF
MRQPAFLTLNPARPLSDTCIVNITRWIGAPGRRGVALAAAVLVAGLGTGAAAATGLDAAADDAAAAQLALRTASVRGALDTTFQRYADTAHDLVAAAATQPGASLGPTVTRIATDRLPGAHQVVVISPTRQVLAERTLDGSTPPPRTSLDVSPDLDRGLQAARSRGRLIAGPAHVLDADLDLPPAHRQPAFELIAPVHDTAFRGWVVIGVRASDLLRDSLRAAGVTGVAAVLSSTAPDGVTHEVARWSADGAGAASDAFTTVDVALAGHAWQVRVSPTTDLISTGQAAAAPLTMLGAAVLSLLLAGTVLTVGTHRHRAAREARDAYDRQQAEVARAQATELDALTRADAAAALLREREAELTGFARAAGENLHAPLHTIAGFTELLLEETAPQLDEASRGFLDRIGASTRRMLTLVDELLTYSAAADAALKLEPVDTTALTLGVVAGRLDTVQGERPSIDVGDLPPVLADGELLGEVLGQLVDNATRFVRHGTAPRITVSAREQSPGWWRVEVADRGIGVPEDQRTRIFQPFHRAPAAEGFPGTGLGLAVCRRIIDLHGGDLGVDPNPGGGSIFWFTLAATNVALRPELLTAEAA